MATITTRRASYRENLETIEADLRAMAERLRTLVATPVHCRSLRDVLTIYSNVAYTFAYLEGSQRYPDYQGLLPWYDVFFRNDDLAVEVSRALAEGACDEPDLDELRLTWLAWFDARRRTRSRAVEERAAELDVAFRAVLDRMQERQHEFIGRLGIDTSRASPSIVLADTVSRIDDPATRTKLTRAWRLHVRDDVSSLIDVLDDGVELRRRDARAAGYGTVLQRTLASSTISEADAEGFLRDYLVRSLAAQRDLESAIGAATGATERQMDHFGRYVRGLVGPGPMPTFRLDACLDFAFSIARQVLGVTVTRVPPCSPHAMTVGVRRDSGEEAGTVDFDLLPPGPALGGPAPPAMAGARPGTDPATPKAHVLCRLHPGGGDVPSVTFDAAQTIFHEFGHALHHVLLRRRLPGPSGVEHLPLERLEDVSMWFEKWVYHRDFAAAVSLPEEAAEQLAVCRRVRALEFWSTNLESAVVAALDFDVHRRQEGGFRQAYERLDGELGLDGHCDLADLPGYLTHLVFQATPGAGFVYLWGAASSAEAFEPFRWTSLADAVPATARPDALARSWSDPTVPSVRPGTDALFDLIASVVATGPLDAAPR